MEIKLQEKPYQKSSFLVRKSLMNNGKKHKKEFPGLTKEGYLKKAQGLVGSTSRNVLSKKKKDGLGDIVKFNTKTGEFVSVTKNDVIKTFFKPKYGQKDWKKKAREYCNKQ